MNAEMTRDPTGPTTWPAVELRELRTFLTVAEELHFARAAERLGVNPSRVTQIIHDLEVKVGGRLFERTSRRVRLTPLGQQLRDRAAPGYRQLERAFNDTRQSAAGLTGTLRIGTYTPVNSGPFMVDIVRAFQEHHPGCEVVFMDTGLQRPLLDWLRSGEVDMMAMRLPITAPDVEIGSILSREECVLLVSKRDPLASRGSVTFEDFADRAVADNPNFPREMVEGFLPPGWSEKQFRKVNVASISEAMTRAALGDLVQVSVRPVLEYVRHPGIAAVPIRDAPPSETALIWLTANRPPKVRAFARVAAEVLEAGGAAAGLAPSQPRPPIGAAR